MDAAAIAAAVSPATSEPGLLASNFKAGRGIDIASGGPQKLWSPELPTYMCGEVVDGWVSVYLYLFVYLPYVSYLSIYVPDSIALQVRHVP